MSDGESSSWAGRSTKQSGQYCKPKQGRCSCWCTLGYSRSVGWGRESQAPFAARETPQHLLSSIWEMLAQVSGWALCQPMAVSSVWASVSATETSEAVEQSAGCPVSGSLQQFFWGSGKGLVGCTQSVCGVSLDLGLHCCEDQAVGFPCAFSVFLPWSSSSARLNISVPFHDSPHSFRYALGREEEPVIMSKLAILCSNNCFMVCLSWWLQEWKISLWDDVEDLCLHALSLGSSLLYVLRHPQLQSGCLKEMGFLWGLGLK